MNSLSRKGNLRTFAVHPDVAKSITVVSISATYLSVLRMANCSRGITFIADAISIPTRLAFFNASRVKPELPNMLARSGFRSRILDSNASM